jgi:hypothetical protein
MTKHPDTIDRFEKQFLLSDEEIHEKFESLKKSRRNKKIKKLAKRAGATVAGVVVLAAGANYAAGEVYSAGNDAHHESAVSWLAKPVAEVADRAGDMINPDIETSGVQSVIAKKGDTIIGLVEENVRGVDTYSTGEQFNLLVEKVVESPDNSIIFGDGRILHAGDEVFIPKSVKY